MQINDIASVRAAAESAHREALHRNILCAAKQGYFYYETTSITPLETHELLAHGYIIGPSPTAFGRTRISWEPGDDADWW